MQITPQARVDDYRKKGWWRGETVDAVFAAAVAASGDKEALVDPPNRMDLTGDEPQRLTYAEAGLRVEQMAQRFAKLGVGRDDIVMMQIPNVIEGVLAFLACARMGAILSPVSMAFRASELRSVMERLNPALFVTVETFHGHDFLAMVKGLKSEGVFSGQVVTIGGGAETHALSNVDVNDAEALPVLQDRDAAEVLTICWTSGTEAEPKGVPRHHDHWTVNGEAMIEAAGLSEGDSFLNPFPLVNIAAFGGMLMPWLMSRGKFVQHHPFDLKTFLLQFQQEEINYSVAPPAILTMLLKDEQLLEGIDFSRVKCIGSGSAPLPPFMVKAWQEKYGVPVMNIFGSNEGCSLFSSANDIEDPELRAKYFPRFGAPGVGWNSEFASKVKTRLADPDTDEEVTEPGGIGELRLDGAMIFDGYWKADELNSRAFDDQGYFRTGDLFQIADDPENRFYQFVGRSKEIVIRGGVNISPAEVEGLIGAHPDIQEAACVGYPDSRLGERLCAVVALKERKSLTLEELTDFLNEKEISAYKLPEKLRMVDALPRNALGKVVRRELTDVAKS